MNGNIVDFLEARITEYESNSDLRSRDVNIAHLLRRLVYEYSYNLRINPTYEPSVSLKLMAQVWKEHPEYDQKWAKWLKPEDEK